MILSGPFSNRRNIFLNTKTRRKRSLDIYILFVSLRVLRVFVLNIRLFRLWSRSRVWCDRAASKKKSHVQTNSPDKRTS